MDIALTPALLAYCAGFANTLGFLIINQITLRLMILVGSALWISYYATIDTEPLWEAITMVSIQATGVAIGLGFLIARRSRLMLQSRDKDLFERFPEMPPGDFGSIMRAADRFTVDADTVISSEGGPFDKIYYIVAGSTRIDKLGESFRMPEGWFVGEVAYLTKRPSVATTTLFAGSEVLCWDIRQIVARSKKNARFRLAFEAMISHNLAVKVGYAVAPRNLAATQLDQHDPVTQDGAP